MLQRTDITLISGDWDTPGCVIEIPHTTSNLGTGPIYEVDPKTRKCKTTLQRFQVTAIQADGTRDLKPIPRSMKQD